MRDNRSAPLTMRLRRGEVCVADGFGIRIRVDKQHLVIDDGSGRNRRTRRYARATHGLSRLVVIGSEGYVTLEAIRWLTSLGIGYLHLDRDGTILASTENGSGDARLRRLQASAVNTVTGIEIGRYLLDAKLEGQAHNLERIPNSERPRGAIGYWRQRISEARTLDELLEAEREAAAAYWACWAPLPLRFARRDLDRVPDHWHRVGTRHSPLSGGSRVAITPANAILNYLYAILEAETRIACLTLGLDPGLGIWHADYRSRDSFALDLMEAARPNVDRFVLQLIDTCVFTRMDVGETSRGICRLLPPLTLELAQSAGQWRDAIAPHAEHVARLLAGTPSSRVDQLATPLTGWHRSRGQDHRRRRVPARRTAEKPAPNCKCCGGPVPHGERVYCDTCLARTQRERRASSRASGLIAVPAMARVTSRRCKSCGDPVPHRKRVYCDPCFAAYEAQLAAMRRPCKGCGEPVPNRKRVYCDECPRTS
jgi:CRISPR-associated protein Cas1